LIISAIFVLIIVIFFNFRLNSGRTLEHILKMIKYYNVHGVHLLLNTSIESPEASASIPWGRLPSVFRTVAGLWLYLRRWSFRLWQYFVAYVQSAHLYW
jgi:hypothetical protein